MSPLRGSSSWEQVYRGGNIESLPWYWPSLDRDLDAALARFWITSGRVLDQGTGPGTQAIALAERGFDVTGADISASAIAHATHKAKSLGAHVTFVRDDILSTRLKGPFDVVFDRGCFHVLDPEDRARYAETMHRLIAPSGLLFLKTFSHREPGTQGPYRFSPDQIRTSFGPSRRFDVLEIRSTDYQGQLDRYPRALFCTIRRAV
jgi:2-polyprenyl-3-methyl-5-hydroxy-6-metoxy-1,4-benzoquinol methylase